jgi:hypothetical protein
LIDKNISRPLPAQDQDISISIIAPVILANADEC